MTYEIGLDICHGNNTFPPSKGVYRNGEGYPEHDFGSKLGIAIEKLLKHNGFKVYKAQEPFSAEVNLNKRIGLYNRRKVDLVFSGHANYSSNSNVDGRCAFYWHSSGKSKSIAEKVIEEIKKAGYSTHGNGLHASKLNSWTNLAICRATNMPAVLVEHGFMGNDDDFELIFGSKQSEYVQDMARADVKAICRYFGKAFKDLDDDTKIYTPPKKKKKPATVKKPNKANLTVDGYFGKATTKALQKALGTYADGIISGQYRNNTTKQIYSVDYGPKYTGSNVILALQKKIGAKADGYIGPETVRKLQRYLGTPVDGVISQPSLMVKELQRRLNKGTF